MKKCPNCQADNADSAQFCSSCGSRLNAADESSSWYYVDHGKSQGPYPVSEFKALIASGKITPDTYIWTSGMEAWTPLKETALAQQSTPVQLDLNKGEQPVSSSDAGYPGSGSAAGGPSAASASNGWGADQAQTWYYAKDGHTYGPYALSLMQDMIRSGELRPDSLVWKEGFSDWMPLSQTELAASIPGGPRMTTTTTTTTTTTMTQSPVRSSVAGRSLATSLILTIVTCGLYGLFWQISLADDVNRLSAERGQPQGVSGAMAILLMIITCGIYSPFFYYQLGDRLYRMSDGRLSNNSVLLAIFGYFMPIVSMMVAQSQINDLVGYNNNGF